VSALVSFTALLVGGGTTPTERKQLWIGFLCAFTMFAGYAMLRPVREAMGVTSGVRSLPALFWAVFFVMLLLQPIYGWVMSRFRKIIVLPSVYLFVAATLVAFYVWFNLQDDHTWIARAYFVWVSVFNLFVVSVFWSLMVDLFNREQAARLFGFLISGISAGGLVGPLLSSLLAQPIGTINLLLVAAVLFCAAAALLAWLAHDREGRVEQQTLEPEAGNEPTAKVGAWAAFVQLRRSRYLMLIAAFLLLVTFINTVLYVELQRVVASSLDSRDQQTTFFARIDVIVQAGALLTQLLLFPRLLRWLGFTKSFSLLPLLMVVSLAAVALAPVLMVIAAASVMRRISEYGITRPCREMLFTVVPQAEKYLAKSLIDTFVFRGGDAISASLLAAVTALAVGSVVAESATAIVGVVVCVVWLVIALILAKHFGEMQPQTPSERPDAALAPSAVNTRD
jgi:AAA family ATP:ADP antiporter